MGRVWFFGDVGSEVWGVVARSRWKVVYIYEGVVGYVKNDVV